MPNTRSYTIIVLLPRLRAFMFSIQNIIIITYLDVEVIVGQWHIIWM